MPIEDKFNFGTVIRDMRRDPNKDESAAFIAIASLRGSTRPCALVKIKWVKTGEKAFWYHLKTHVEDLGKRIDVLASSFLIDQNMILLNMPLSEGIRLFDFGFK